MVDDISSRTEISMKKLGLSLSLAGLWVAAAFALLPLSASAQDAVSAPAKQLRIGFQKAGLLAVLKAQGSLEQKLKPLGYTVSWY
jgi:sulfonate transport system substrate-binding protein